MKKSFTLSKSTRFARCVNATLLFALCCGVAVPLHAQSYSKTESFQNATAPGFILGGAADNSSTPDGGRAVLTAGGVDAAGQGYLRLTSTDLFQVAYAIDKTSFSTANGFSVAFDYGSYGSTTTEPGDGICAFFVNSTSGTFTIGGSGGSLGYTQQTDYPASVGVTNGYLGIGFDEFGNFSNSTSGHTGGPGRVPNAVALRGAGSGATGFPFLTGTQTLDFSIAGAGATRSQFTSADARYRRAYIDVRNTAGSYLLTIRIQHGSETTTVLADYALTSMPATLQFGIAGATGGNNSIYEIRNLSIQADAVTSTNQAANRAALALYPNPAADNLTLDMTKVPTGTYKVQLVDLLGRELQQQQLTGGASHQLDVEGLAAGAYLVMVQGQSFKATLPLVHK